MKYEAEAIKATDAGLSPASPQDTCAVWRKLGVTRQTEHRWRSDHSLVPLAARFAAAWVIHNEGRTDD